jgi:hypothetical protein
MFLVLQCNKYDIEETIKSTKKSVLVKTSKNWLNCLVCDYSGGGGIDAPPPSPHHDWRLENPWRYLNISIQGGEDFLEAVIPLLNDKVCPHKEIFKI